MLQRIARACSALKEAGKCGKKVSHVFLGHDDRRQLRWSAIWHQKIVLWRSRPWAQGLPVHISGPPKGEGADWTPHERTDEGTKLNVPIHSTLQSAAPH
jgi:hypothetical protein